MEFQFTLTEDDMLGAHFATIRGQRSVPRRIAPLAGTVGVAVGGVVGVLAWSAPLGLLAALASAVLVLVVCTDRYRLRIRDRVRSGLIAAPTLHRRVVVSQLGIAVEAGDRRGSWPWSSVIRAAVYPSHVLLWTGPSGGVMIPSSAISDRLALVQQLRQWLQGRLEIHTCLDCNYDVSAGNSGRCPECGRPIGETA